MHGISCIVVVYCPVEVFVMFHFWVIKIADGFV
jgi:hypothetical protein